MSRDEKLRFITKVVGIGFSIAVIYHLILGLYFKLTYPYNTFLFRPDDNFMDFIWPYTIAINPYLISRADFQNFPFLYAIMRVFRLFGNVKIALGIYLVIFLFIFSLSLRKNLLKNNSSSSYISLFVLIAFSYPLLISLQRANLELLVFLFIFLFFFFYQRNRLISSLFLSCAIALKPFPVVFITLLFWDKRYLDILITTITTTLLTLLSLLILPGGVVMNISNLLRNLSLYTQVYSIGNEGLFFGNSLWGAMKYLVGLFNPLMQVSFASLLKPYFFIAIGMFVILICLITKYKLDFNAKVLLLICAMDLLPYVSGDYKLMYFYIPLVMFINNNKPQKMDWLYALLLGLLFIPKNYINLFMVPEANISILLNPLIMIILCVLVIVPKKRSLIYQ
jgi:hypothetical protein